MSKGTEIPVFKWLSGEYLVHSPLIVSLLLFKTSQDLPSLFLQVTGTDDISCSEANCINMVLFGIFFLLLSGAPHRSSALAEGIDIYSVPSPQFLSPIPPPSPPPDSEQFWSKNLFLEAAVSSSYWVPPQPFGFSTVLNADAEAETKDCVLKVDRSFLALFMWKGYKIYFNKSNVIGCQTPI